MSSEQNWMKYNAKTYWNEKKAAYLKQILVLRRHKAIAHHQGVNMIGRTCKAYFVVM